MIQDICTLYFESISDPSSDLSQKLRSTCKIGKQASCLCRNNYKVLHCDLAAIKNQKFRKYNRAYLKRLSSFVALMPMLRAVFATSLMMGRFEI